MEEQMTVALLWILVTISDGGHGSGITSVVGKFVTQVQCEKVRAEMWKMDQVRSGFGGGATGFTHHKSRCIEAEIVVVK
jgi:hypothetical protein